MYSEYDVLEITFTKKISDILVPAIPTIMLKIPENYSIFVMIPP